MIFKDWSEKLHELGFNVLPCSGKKPVVLWQGWIKKRQPIEIVQGYADLYPEANIAIMVGHGCVVIDVDTDTREQTKTAWEICKRVLPESPMKMSAARGFKLIYRGDVPNKCTKSSLALDILGTGSIAVAPPSIHPDTRKPYVWSNETVLTHVKELPEITIDDVRKLEEEFLRHGLSKVKSVGHHQQDSIGDGSCHVGNRNNYFASLAWELITTKEITGKTDAEIMNFLVEEDMLHLGERSYFADPREFKTSNRLENVKVFYKRHLKAAQDKDALYPNYYRPQVVDAQTAVSDSAAVSGVVESVESITDLGMNQHYDFIRLQRERVLSLIPRGGLIELVTAYTIEIGNNRSPVLPFCGSLGLCSVLASNTYQTRDCWPNLYLFGVAFSGRGKSFPQKAIRRILDKCGGGLSNYIGPTSYGSGPGVLADIPTRPKRSRIDLYDEFGGFLKEVKEKNKHLASAKEIVTQAWSDSNSMMGARALARSTALPIRNPALTLLGFTTPDEFKDNIDKNFISSGFGARFLYMYDDLLPEDKTELHEDDVVIHVSPEIIKRVKRIAEIEPNYETFGDAPAVISNISDDKEMVRQCIEASITSIVPYRIQLTRDGMASLRRCAAKQDNLVHTLQHGKGVGETDFRVPLVQRRTEQCLRLAVIYAVSEQKVDAIEPEHLEWAEKVWQFHFDNVSYHLDGTFDNLTQRPEKVIGLLVEWIRNQRGTLIRKSDFRKKLTSLYPRNTLQTTIDRELASIERQMLEDGVLKDVRRSPSSGHLQYLKT